MYIRIVPRLSASRSRGQVDAIRSGRFLRQVEWMRKVNALLRECIICWRWYRESGEAFARVCVCALCLREKVD